LIAAHYEFAVAGDADLDLVAFFQIQGLDDGCRKSDCEAVPPSGYLHGCPPLIYTG